MVEQQSIGLRDDHTRERVDRGQHESGLSGHDVEPGDPKEGDASATRSIFSRATGQSGVATPWIGAPESG
jgi:hypothetical protein